MQSNFVHAPNDATAMANPVKATDRYKFFLGGVNNGLFLFLLTPGQHIGGTFVIIGKSS